MWAASDIAEWWEDQNKQAKKELDVFVDQNPDLFGVLVATTVTTAIDVGAATVDLLRFGEGMAEGGVAGGAKDALRLFGLLSPLGRGAKMIQAAANGKLARLIVDPGGPICAWVSGTQALRQTGTRALAPVDDLAAALGVDLTALGPSHMWPLVAALRRLGAKISSVRVVNGFDDVANMTNRNGGVSLFSIFGKRLNGPATYCTPTATALAN